ncbi:hypothetical protein [Nocardia salmonicida]|uniref:hypothetical protein n=1 Tax=Nocardia salmonicida TaxID=53431 RepID=UPI0007A43C65|nr:hypothetical protein [Nocardia salmonicida]
MPGRSFTVLAAAAAALTLVATGTVSADPNPIAPAPATVPGTISDGPGSFHVYRTVDSGLRPSSTDNAQCNSYFGSPRSIAVLERLDARIYTFTNNDETGFLTDPTARDVGPIYVCDGPTIDGRAFLDQWGKLTAPGLGDLTMSGPCGLEFYIGEPGRVGVDCVLAVDPNSTGVTGGVATSNSVANPARLPNGRTGSLWTVYSMGAGTAPVADPAPGKPQPTGSVKYSVGREVNSRSLGRTSACPGGVRTTEIHSVSTDPATGAVTGEPSGAVAAHSSICYGNPAEPDFAARLDITIEGVSPPLTVSSDGQCRQQDVTGLVGSRQQSCGFTLLPDFGRGLTGGQVTLNGLVPVDDPAGSDNSAIWSTGLLGSIAPR